MNNRLIYKGNWSFPVRKDFILNPNYTVGEKMLYIAIRSYCSPDGDTAFPSSETLAASLNISRDTVFVYAKGLESKGLLAREQQKTDLRQFLHTVYTLFSTEVPFKAIKSGVRAVTGIPRNGEKPLRGKPVAGKTGPNKVVPIIVKEVTREANGADAPGAAKEPEQGPLHPVSKKRQFTDRWIEEYNKAHRVPYKFDGAADGKAADRLLATGMGVDEIIGIAVKAWSHPELFWCKHATTVKGFDCKFNDIAQELEHPPVNGNRNGGVRIFTPEDRVANFRNGHYQA